MPDSGQRNPFAASDTPTLEDVLALVASDTTVALSRRQGWISALRSLATWNHRPLSAIPADPRFVMTLLDRHSAAALGVSKRHLQNVRSRLIGVLRHSGHGTHGQWQAPLTPAWAALDRQLTQHQQAGLRRLMRFCSAQGVAPGELDDGVAAVFAAALEADGTVKNPREKVQTAARVWNRCREAVSGWPDQLLTVPRYRQTYSLDWVAFPESFKSDADAFLHRLGQDGDLLAEQGPPRALSTSTVRTRGYQIRQFASALVHRGVPAESLATLADLVTVERFRLGLRFFLERNGNAPSPMIADLGYTMKVIARHWVRVDPAALDAMRAICARLGKSLPGAGLTEKNRRRLSAFDDPAVLRRFLRLPMERMGQQPHEPPTRRAAAQASVAAALAILVVAPMRIKNLAALDLERHLRWRRESDRWVLEIFIAASEVKNRQALQFRVTGPYAEVVDWFCQHFRPRLDGVTGRA